MTLGSHKGSGDARGPHAASMREACDDWPPAARVLLTYALTEWLREVHEGLSRSYIEYATSEVELRDIIGAELAARERADASA